MYDILNAIYYYMEAFEAFCVSVGNSHSVYRDHWADL